MAWLSLLLFLPWFLLLGSLYWLFPRQPRTARRRLFDGTTLLLAFALSIVSMLWGYRIGVVQPGAGPIWPQVLAVLYAYGAFLAVLVLALLLRPRFALRSGTTRPKPHRIRAACAPTMGVCSRSCQVRADDRRPQHPHHRYRLPASRFRRGLPDR